MASKEVPDPSTWRFVLRKVAIHNPEIEERVSGYDESVQSRDITHPDGVRRRTIFISSEHFCLRLLKRGWEDASSLWREKGTQGEAPDTSSTGKLTAKGRRPVTRIAG